MPRVRSRDLVFKQDEKIIWGDARITNDGTAIVFNIAVEHPGGINYIEDIGNVSITNPANNDSLIYNASLQVWENGPSSIAINSFAIRGDSTSENAALFLQDESAGTLGLIYYDVAAGKLVISYHDPITNVQENYMTIYDGQVDIDSDLDVNGDVTADSFNGYETDTARGTTSIVVRDAGGDIFVDDVYAYRGDGTGVIFLGDSSHYLWYNGTYYSLPTSDLYINGNRVPKFTISTSSPSGGTDGDVWFKY